MIIENNQDCDAVFEDALDCSCEDNSNNCRHVLGYVYQFLVLNNYSIPNSIKEVYRHPESELWIDAMKKEYDQLIKNKTWQLVDLPNNRKAIKCKWAFALKYNKDGSIEMHKARLVAKVVAKD